MVDTVGRSAWTPSNPLPQIIVSKHNIFNGTREWIQRSGGRYDRDEATAIALRGAHIYVLGETQQTGKDRQCVLSCLEKASGKELYSKVFGSSGDDSCRSMVVDDGGHIYVTGSAAAADGDFLGSVHGKADVLVMKLKATGNDFFIIWTSLYGGAGYVIFHSLLQFTTI